MTPPAPKRGVDGDLPGPGLQALYEGCEKDRPVARAVRRRGTGRGVVERPHAGHERQGDGHVSRRIRLGRSRRRRRCGRAALVDQVPDLGELGGAELRLLGLPELVGNDLDTAVEADEDHLVDDLGEGPLLRREQQATLGVDLEAASCCR